jgi:hypothetical protein
MRARYSGARPSPLTLWRPLAGGRPGAHDSFTPVLLERTFLHDTSQPAMTRGDELGRLPTCARQLV